MLESGTVISKRECGESVKSFVRGFTRINYHYKVILKRVSSMKNTPIRLKVLVALDTCILVVVCVHFMMYTIFANKAMSDRHDIKDSLEDMKVSKVDEAVSKQRYRDLTDNIAKIGKTLDEIANRQSINEVNTNLNHEVLKKFAIPSTQPTTVPDLLVVPYGR